MIGERRPRVNGARPGELGGCAPVCWSALGWRGAGARGRCARSGAPGAAVPAAGC